MNTLLITGGCGFIGSNFILHVLRTTDARIVNLDAMTYAANPFNLSEAAGNSRLIQVRGDICDQALVGRLLEEHRPAAVVHFAAESHVDRSIHDPHAFLRTNITGTFTLLEAARGWWAGSAREEREQFRFLHVSTDEVFGSLGPDDAPFHERSPYAPNSPYAASKAASDQFARAYHHTYGLPVIITNCSNNYGPRQHPEKLIPLMILHALADRSLPIYGDGRNVRDWLYVEDHCVALAAILTRGTCGESYLIGGKAERNNLDMVHTLCALLDEMRPRADGRSYREQIRMVPDRPGHDRRYAIDPGKLAREFGWLPAETLDTALAKTIRWYIDNAEWVRAAMAAETYQAWIERNYAQRSR